MFVGRATELKALEKRWNSGKFELCVIYGRRRVGKTTLIREFIKNKNSLFWTAMETEPEANLKMLARAIFQNEKGQPPFAFSSFDDAFEYVFDKAETERLVFVIDEYPFLAQTVQGISSILQRLIDERKANSKLFLIINGSSISLMEDYFSTYKKPLYGRKTCQIKVEPFGFFDSCKFHPNVEPVEQLAIYGAFGGIPKYLEEYNGKYSFKENVIENFLQKGAPLFDEPQSILKQEVRDAASYNAILGAIADGCTRYSEIADKTKIGSSAIAGFVSNLLSLNLIKKESPVPDNGSRRPLYKLNDNMLRFWFRFVPDNLSLIAMGKDELAYQHIMAQLDTYFGSTFEDVALEYLWRINGSNKLPFAFTNAGRWWGPDAVSKKETEIDIIAVSSLENDSHKALFCECKWQKQYTGKDVLDSLIEKSQLAQFKHYTEKCYILFTRNDFTKGCKDAAAASGRTLLFTYKDMFG
jgi:AAA+ ATPase superfamily predicted ATPase